MALNIPRLSIANLSRNRKRTIATLLTLAMGGVLIVSLSTLFNCIDEMDYARNVIRKGEFRIDLLYNRHDWSYPENNLDRVQALGLMDEALEQQLLSIPGVSQVEREYAAMVSIDHPAYTSDERDIILSFNREDIPLMEPNLRSGSLDYDKMLSEGGLLCPWDIDFVDKGLQIGEKVKLNLFFGDQVIPYEGTLLASSFDGGPVLYMPEEQLTALMGSAGADATNALYVHAEESRYEEVKEALQSIVDAGERFALVSLDEEIIIYRQQMDSVKQAGYIVLLILGVICFVNLINTMVTSIVTRRRELGVLQAIGLSPSQLGQMLWQEGLVFSLGTLALSLGIGIPLGYGIFLWAKANTLFSISAYHFPWLQILILALALFLGQAGITLFSRRFVQKESLVEQMRA